MADKRTTAEQGKSGTTIYTGQISGEEYNYKLQGKNALKEFDEMRRSDATVNAALTAIKLPIKQAHFAVDKVSDDEKDVRAAEVVEKSLFEFVDWDKFLDECLTYQEFGFSVFEAVYEPREIDGTTYICLTKLGYRKQTTISAWETQEKGEGVTQQLAEGKTISIPIEKIVRFTNRQEGDNYEGRSILRSAYKSYYFKDKLDKIDLMGHERQGLGILDIIKPEGALPADVAKMIKAARNIRANSQSYIMRTKGWEVSFMDMKGKSMKDIDPARNYHDRQISKNVLTQFLELGAAGGSGSRATSEDHSRLFEMSVQAVAEYIVKVLQTTVVKNIIDLNFTNIDYPKLSVSRISDDNIPEISEAFVKFVTAGVLHPVAADENKVRKMIGMGEVDPEELDALYEKPEATEGDDTEKEASALISQVKSLRASVERKLFEPSPVTQVHGSVSARDYPSLYEGTGVDPDELGCIMVDLEPLVVTSLVDDGDSDLVSETTRHDHAMGAVAEVEPHITLLYGLLENGNTWKDEVDMVLDGWSMKTATIESVDYFDTPDSFAVIAHIKATDALIDGHQRLTLLPHIQTFSEYKPHMTLAYIKKDADVKKWVSALSAAYVGKQLKVQGVNYGDLPNDKSK